MPELLMKIRHKSENLDHSSANNQEVIVNDNERNVAKKCAHLFVPTEQLCRAHF